MSRYVLQAYGFPSEYENESLESFVKEVLEITKNSKELFLHIRWMNETKALLSFNNQALADKIRTSSHPVVKIRPWTATKSSERPETTPVVARRMITNILGVKAEISPEQKAMEEKQLAEAREKKRAERQERQKAEEEATKTYWGDE